MIKDINRKEINAFIENVSSGASVLAREVAAWGAMFGNIGRVYFMASKKRQRK